MTETQSVSGAVSAYRLSELAKLYNVQASETPTLHYLPLNTLDHQPDTIF